jgi:hypothetical protein
MYTLEAIENNFPMTQVNNFLADQEDNHESA